MKTGIKVLDAMTMKPVTVRPDMTVQECAKLMMKEKVGSVLIEKDHKIAGILTEKDIVGNVIVKSLDPKKVTVESIMTKNVETIEPDQDIYEAILKMKKKGVRRLPVVHNSHLVGLLTMTDVLKIEPQLFDLVSEKLYVREGGKKPSTKYLEGECESCEAYGRLYNVNGQYVCEECKDEIS
ncbi:CBS domain-containing protein [Candidatus Woesearchaeota archaeon]|nr:CBS domain-containing protein [Candidatus Woesearchaeota archaeon]